MGTFLTKEHELSLRIQSVINAGMKSDNLSSMLHGAGENAAKIFDNLCKVLYNKILKENLLDAINLYNQANDFSSRDALWLLTGGIK